MPAVPLRALGLALLLLAAGGAMPSAHAAAQDPAQAPDSARADVFRPDTLRADSASQDTSRTRTRIPNPAADSIIAALKALPGYVATEYAADTVVYQVNRGLLRLWGRAEVRRDGSQVTADTIVYRDSAQLVEAYGSPRVTGEGQDLEGDTLYYDLARRAATVRGARTTLVQSATWFVTGDMTAVGEDRVYASHAQFTTCDLTVPHYHFSAGRIKVVRDQILVAAPAVLYFGKVPVMVLPFVVQNLEEGRRSGLLVPRFSITDIVRNSPGYTRQISDLGWYWAVNDYLGAQVAGTWRSGAYVSLLGNLTFNWRRQFLGGNFGFSRYWQSSGDRQFGVNSSASWRPDERTNLSLSANYISSAQFIRRTTIDPREATQDMTSTLNASRRFDWGTLNVGSELRKSIANGGISATLPSFSVSPNAVTLLREADPALARWYNNISLAWSLSGARTLARDQFLSGLPRPDETRTRLDGGLGQFSVGNLNLSLTGSFNEETIHDLRVQDATTGEERLLAGRNAAAAQWSSSLSYQLRLLGQNTITPALGLGQELRRDTLTGGEFVAGPRRVSFGAGTSTSLFGFFPGVGPFSGFRHRVSPSISYSYSPAVQLSERQRQVFGAVGGITQNRVSLTVNQTWEAKLRVPNAQTEPRDTSVAAGADSLARQEPAAPAEPEKVTLLSISTSPFEYDFSRAAFGQSGFLTRTVSNTISSDYLRGLNIQMTHELFDQSGLNPSDSITRGRLGRFSPRLSSLSTGFDLGPSSALFRWLGVASERNPVTQGEIPGAAPSGSVTPLGSPTATNNPQSVGAGAPWRMGFRYSYSQPERVFVQPGTPGIDLGSSQTLDADFAFPLTPGWAMTWNTSYSLTDREFGSHSLNFRRDLHRWQANFSFYQTPSGNTAFEFFVELIDNPDIKFDHRETDLGIDRP